MTFLSHQPAQPPPPTTPLLWSRCFEEETVWKMLETWQEKQKKISKWNLNVQIKAESQAFLKDKDQGFFLHLDNL